MEKTQRHHLLAQDAAGGGRHPEVTRQLARKLLALCVQPCGQELDHQQSLRRPIPLSLSFSRCFLLPAAAYPAVAGCRAATCAAMPAAGAAAPAAGGGAGIRAVTPHRLV